MDAAQSGKWDDVLAYLKSGGNPNLLDENGKSLLEWAALYGDVSIMNELIGAGANVNHQDDEGVTALMTASSEERLEAIKLLLDSGANIETKNSIGQTAFLVSVENSRLDALALLVEKGARLDVTFGDNDFNAYLLASTNGNLTVMDRLIEVYPEFVSSKDRSGRSAAHWTCADGDVQSAAAVIRHGGRLDAQDNFGRRAFDYGQDQGSGACLAFIEEAGLKDYF